MLQPTCNRIGAANWHNLTHDKEGIRRVSEKIMCRLNEDSLGYYSENAERYRLVQEAIYHVVEHHEPSEETYSAAYEQWLKKPLDEGAQEAFYHEMKGGPVITNSPRFPRNEWAKRTKSHPDLANLERI